MQINTTYINNDKSQILSPDLQARKHITEKKRQRYFSYPVESRKIRLVDKGNKNFQKVRCFNIKANKTLHLDNQDISKLADDFYHDLINAVKKSTADWNIGLDNSKKSIAEFYHRNNFFVIMAPKISILLDKVANSNIGFINIGKEVINLINNSLIFKTNEKYFFENLIHSMVDYKNIIEYLNTVFKLDGMKCYRYVNNIYKQFIEGDALYKSFTDYESDKNDLGAFLFNSCYLYINRCLLSWIYMVDKLIIKSEPLNMGVLIQLARFFDCGVSRKNMQYGILFQNNNSEQIVNVLADGLICNLIDYDNKADIPIELHKKTRCIYGVFSTIVSKDFLENYINTRLTDISVKLSKVKNDFFIDKIIKQENGKLKIITCKPVSNREPYLYKIYHMNKGLNLLVEFDATLPYKQVYCKKIMNEFNAEFKSIQSNKDKLISILKLATKMQKAHLFEDANGRIYCLIVAILLLKLGLWLTRQPFEIWTLIEGYDLEKLADIYLNLCVPIAAIDKNCDFNWYDATFNHKEKLRIAYALGEQQTLEEVVTNNPKLPSPFFL